MGSNPYAHADDPHAEAGYSYTRQQIAREIAELGDPWDEPEAKEQEYGRATA